MMEEGIYPMNREGLSALSAESDRLTRLVDELKILADLESPELVLEKKRLSLPEIIQEVVEAAEPTIQRSHLNVDIVSAEDPEDAILLEIEGDRGKIQRLLSNLLSNAIRYADSRITIGFGLTNMEAGRVEILVEDDGRGIPDEDKEKVFERYYRVDSSRNRSSGGSGLGLSICSEIVRAHGGSIEVGDSQLLGGAEFRVLLPVAS